VQAGLPAASRCLPCPLGTSSEAGALFCSGCPANTFNNLDTRLCTACPPNSTAPAGAVMNGCQCGAGLYQFYRTRAVGGTESVVASDGQWFRWHLFSPSGTLRLLRDTFLIFVCDGTTRLSYAPFTESDLAVPGDLMPGVTCSTSSQVGYQISGSFDASASTTYFRCEACPAGKFNTQLGADACASCRSGYYADTVGATTCQECDLGYVSEDGASACTSCPAGQFQSSSARCDACPAGTYSGDPPSFACTRCAPGTWSSAGAVACTACPYLSTSPGGTDKFGCVCQAGLYLSPNGQYCLQCDAGKFSSGGGACTACPLGSYAPTPGSGACTACPAGAVTDGIGAVACTACPVGYTPLADLSNCTICPLGSYCTLDGQVQACPTGSYVTAPGLSSADECGLCPANSVCPDSSTLVPCPPNTNSPRGSVSQVQCVCDRGYTCSYTKTLDAVVELAMSPEQFAQVQQEFINAVAQAAGVDPSQVVITSIVPVTPNRRAVPRPRRWVRVGLAVRGGHSLHGLGASLYSRGLPRMARRISLHRGHVVRVVAAPLL
jgi:hypothetical protein